MVYELTPNTSVASAPDFTSVRGPRRQPRLLVPRSTVRDTWGWFWKDTAGRVAPMTGAALLYARLSGEGLAGVGLTRAQWKREMALGIAVGVPLAGIAAAFRGWVAPQYRLPTPADQALQTAFYLAINAPGEELFWRGMVQTAATGAFAVVPSVASAGAGRWDGRSRRLAMAHITVWAAGAGVLSPASRLQARCLAGSTPGDRATTRWWPRSSHTVSRRRDS